MAGEAGMVGEVIEEDAGMMTLPMPVRRQRWNGDRQTQVHGWKRGGREVNALINEIGESVVTPPTAAVAAGDAFWSAISTNPRFEEVRNLTTSGGLRP